ncbi:hypothetical protein EJB05_04427, partial [Eragrostis curvula]
MPGELEKLIVRIGVAAQGGEGVSWLIADVNMAWSFPVAKKLGVRAAGFCPSSAAMFATRIKIPELIRDGVLDEDGWPKRRGAFQLAPATMPVMDTAEISWNRAGDPTGQPFIFQLILRNNAATHLAETVVCNSMQELEPGAFALFPGVVVEELLGGADTKARALALRDVARRAIDVGGSSRRNLRRFVDLLQGSAS